VSKVLKSTRLKFKKFRARYAKGLEKLLFSNKGVKNKRKRKEKRGDLTNDLY
jgi:hypothetical protein